MRLLLFSFSLCLTCWGQGYNYANLPFLAAGTSPPDYLTGLAFRWVSSDLANNVAVSGNWTDRVQSASFHMAASAKQPTNSVNGVWFDTSHYLTNNNETYNLTNSSFNISFGFIWNFVNYQVGGTYPSFLNNTAQYFSDDNTVLGFILPNQVAVENNAAATTISEDPFLGTNFLTDTVISQEWTNSLTAGSFEMYTNAILDVKNATAGGSILWGFPGASRPGPNSLGFNFTRSTSCSFRLLELWIWTNSSQGPISTKVLNSFHNYATNTYPHSP